MSRSAGFGLVFWGLLLVVLDVRIDGHDILPDSIGYVLVAVGCNGLGGVSTRFTTAQTLSLFLALLSLAEIAIPRGLTLVFDTLQTVVDCTMMWFLLGGVMELATARQRPDLCRRASSRRVAYFVFMGVATFASVVAYVSRDTAAVMAVVMAVCLVATLVLILHLIYRVQRELAGGPAA